MSTWFVEGTYVLACNCDYGFCPCNFEAPPTMGWCEATIGCAIESGRYREVPLDGLNTFFAVKWPGPIHKGGGKAKLYIDETADDDQRYALTQIMSGAVGGGPWAVFANTYRIDGPHFVPIHAQVAGMNTKLVIGHDVSVLFQPIRSVLTGAAVFPRVVLPEGLCYREAEQYSSAALHVAAGNGLEFDHNNKSAALARVRWGD